MKIYLNEENLMIDRGGDYEIIGINKSDVVLVEWDDSSIGIHDTYTQYTYRELAGNITDKFGNSLGSTKEEVKTAIGGILSDKRGYHIQSFTGIKSFDSGNAQLLNLFDEVIIRKGRAIRFHLRVPARDGIVSWGGLYINVNAKVNGNWYNLGNCGYDGGVMADSSKDIATYTENKIYDFAKNLGLPIGEDYTLQFELTARSHNGTTIVNGSHDINSTANGLNSRGDLQAWASNQNFTTIIIEEI